MKFSEQERGEGGSQKTAPASSSQKTAPASSGQKTAPASRTPRRVLIFSLAYHPHQVGGAEIAIKEITDRIPPSEIEFDMITLRFDRGAPAFERVGNIDVHRICSGSAFGKLASPFAGTCKALKLLKARRYDLFWPVMVTFTSGIPFMANIVRRLSGKPRIPILLTLQEGDSERHLKRGRLGFIGLSWRLALRRADRVTAISRYLSDRAKGHGFRGEPAIIPNAVDLGLFTKKPNEREIEALKGNMGKKHGDIFLVTTSRLVEKNAVGDIIEALAYLPANVKLIVIGSGDLESKLRSQVAGRGLQDRVQFLGFIPHKELPPYLHISDIFVRPSLSEGLGNSFLEAMAAGLPVIATPVGGIKDFLRDGETGLFCEPGNPRSIAQKAEKLIKDAESRDYMVERARKMVEERYDWTGVAEKMRRVLAA
ncbi:MAG: glycosyltransferase family 4 protein [Patescibacteria group bacterium]|nr:glycosyltransferase family 4 protein [Patescibacteria group bacterium]MDE1966905.1 glycosyltransferase family 4 protein [Patescibacteria group bacterium]